MTQGDSQYLLSREENQAIVLNFIEKMLSCNKHEFEYFLYALGEVAHMQGLIATEKVPDKAADMFYLQK